MRLALLLEGVAHRWVKGDGEVEVTAVTHDSRRAADGTLFVAVLGLKSDGLDFVAQAAARGAVAVVVAEGLGSSVASLAPRVIEVPCARKAMAALARNIFSRPDETLEVVGVTGTNGKTTTCHVLAAMLMVAGRRPGVIGTTGWMAGGEAVPLERTTPEATDLHRILARMRDAGLRSCVMEVSSHALTLDRVHGMRFAAAVFTNLTRDHLDYHRDMESYFTAKAALFEMLNDDGVAAINIDDSFGRRLAHSLLTDAGRRARGVRIVRFGTSEEADLRMERFETGTAGTRVTLRYEGSQMTLTSPLVGEVNAWNVTAAAAAALGLSVEREAIVAGAAAADRVPGRLERVEIARSGLSPLEFMVLVDYAHTDEALRKLLETARQITTGRVIVVFGCGGDRDRTKRPLMGAHAARLGDVIFVTSDNPRSERPETILGEILEGVMQAAPGEPTDGSGRIHVEPDRARAITAAICVARKGDTVVIAGKGHETNQFIGDRVTPFDDRIVARRALEERADQDGPPREARNDGGRDGEATDG